MAAKRWNILYLHSHDTGRWIQPYGFPCETPHLQKFADQGVLFKDAHCAGPTCSPSRAALLTGQSPHSAGMLGLAHRGFQLRDVKQHLIHTLMAVGYQTYLAGIQHVMPKAQDIGYTEVLCGSSPDQMEKVLKFIKTPQEPFFLDVGFFETHRVFPVPDLKKDPHFGFVPVFFPNTPEIQEDLAAYRTSVAQLDQKYGAILNALDEMGLADRTLVLITTDHGPAFPTMKCNLSARGTGVLMMLRGPASVDGKLRFAGGKKIDSLVSHIDVFPTLCALNGIPIPSWVQGHALQPLVDGTATEIRKETFAEVTYHAAYEPQRSVRTKDFCYIKRFGQWRQTVLPNCDASPTKVHYVRNVWQTKELPREELYCLESDPSEANNVAGKEPFKQKQAELEALLNTWMVSTNDPLLKGGVPAPIGARITPVNVAQPEDGIFIVKDESVADGLSG